MLRYPFSLRGGKILGREHARAGRNCQDGYAGGSFWALGGKYWAGVVSDGCSEGKESEIAGILLPKFVISECSRLLNFEVPLSQIPLALYPQVVKFLESIASYFPEYGVRFVADCLLATILGFVVNEKEGMIFWAGDGNIIVNDEVIRINYNDRSPYIGYHLRASELEDYGQYPRTFNTRYLKMEEVKKLAVASDGFSENLLLRMVKEANQGDLGLQLWMNFINGPRNSHPERGQFFDDAAVNLLERFDMEAKDA